MEDLDEDHGEEGARSFAHFIHDLSDGRANLDLSNELFELTRELQEFVHSHSTKTKGQLTVQFTFAAEPGGTVHIAYSVKKKSPEKPRPAGVHWLTEGGNLTPQNPRQQKLPLKEVGGVEKTARDVVMTVTRGREI